MRNRPLYESVILTCNSVVVVGMSLGILVISRFPHDGLLYVVQLYSFINISEIIHRKFIMTCFNTIFYLFPVIHACQLYTLNNTHYICGPYLTLRVSVHGVHAETCLYQLGALQHFYCVWKIKYGKPVIA